MLALLDKFTRQALAVTVSLKMGADDVLETLFPLLFKVQVPKIYPVR